VAIVMDKTLPDQWLCAQTSEQEVILPAETEYIIPAENNYIATSWSLTNGVINDSQMSYRSLKVDISTDPPYESTWVYSEVGSGVYAAFDAVIVDAHWVADPIMSLDDTY